MTIKHTFLISTLFLLVFTSCKTKKLHQSTTNVDTSANDIIIDSQTEMNTKGDDYTLDSVKINGDVLSAFVHYSGGCKDHIFKLYSNNISTRSIPPQMPLCLKHISNGDACRAVFSKEVKFNVSKLKGNSKNAILLIIDENHKVLY